MLTGSLYLAPAEATCFKPLQNGAVLCCLEQGPALRRGGSVSNPFRTGRYCAGICTPPPPWGRQVFQTPSERGGIVLQFSLTALFVMILFQTPSERGGIVLNGEDTTPTPATVSFKPLQNGAVLC